MTVDILTLRLPLCGTIFAGWPSPAEEELGDVLTFEEWLIPRKEASYLVTVGTNVLKSEGIIPEDIAIMEHGRNPQHGDIVIAEVDGQLLIRRYEKAASQTSLVSDAGRTSIGDDSEVRILGVVVSVIRRYR